MKDGRIKAVQALCPNPAMFFLLSMARGVGGKSPEWWLQGGAEWREWSGLSGNPLHVDRIGEEAGGALWRETLCPARKAVKERKPAPGSKEMQGLEINGSKRPIP